MSFMHETALKRTRLLLIALVLLAMLLGGCGYQIQKKEALPFSELKIGVIENLTVEPKLQDRLHRAITREFLKQGVAVTPVAKLTLTGKVNKFEMISLSERAGISVEYRIICVADFRLTDGSGNVVTKGISSPFIVSFTASEDMGSIIAQKETAEEKAAEDIAVELVGAFIYK